MPYNIDIIKAQVETIIAENSDVRRDLVDCTDMMTQWQKNKSKFINAMGGELIYEYPYPVTFTLSEEDKHIKLNSFLEWLNTAFIWEETPNADLYGLYEFIRVNRKDFFLNRLSNEYTANVYINKSEGGTTDPKEITIPAGIKIIRAFKHFIKDKKLLTYLQDKASTYIQEDKIEGTLCLSVHPLDYLSLSENNLNWRSCHSLDGDYAAGNLNYMVDSCTVITYIRNNEISPLPNFGPISWNNKKWRVLLFFEDHNQMIFAGRQYPFSSKDALDHIKKYLFKELRALLPVFDSEKMEWHKDHLERFANIDMEAIKHGQLYLDPYDGKFMTLRNFIHQNSHRLFYNDLLESHCYTEPYYIYTKTSIFTRPIRFFIGQNVVCPICHKRILKNSCSLICDTCSGENYLEREDLVTCFSCDHVIPRDSAFYVGDAQRPYCRLCYDLYTATCKRCNNRYPINEIHWNAKVKQSICEWCQRDLSEIEI